MCVIVCTDNLRVSTYGSVMGSFQATSPLLGEGSVSSPLGVGTKEGGGRASGGSGDKGGSGSSDDTTPSNR